MRDTEWPFRYRVFENKAVLMNSQKLCFIATTDCNYKRFIKCMLEECFLSKTYFYIFVSKIPRNRITCFDCNYLSIYRCVECIGDIQECLIGKEFQKS